MRDLDPGTVFAGHRIDAVVGRGGMGVVYRATQLDLGRAVAVKVVAPDLFEDPVMRDRFLAEAKAAASVDHPNVIPIYYAGEEEGTPYLAMRFVEGDDVRTLVRRSGPLDPDRAARIAAQAGAAIDAVHAAGFVHRDVKPANVLLGPDDHVYVTDFGLAKSTLSRGDTQSGQWVGTLDYVSPEQIRGAPVDARSDVYALGGVLHFMLTGRPPYPRDGDEAKLWAHLSDAPPRPSEHGAPAEFDEIVARALAKEPDDRYPSAGDLGRAAVAAAAGREVSEPERMVARGRAAPASAEADTAIADQSTITSTRPALDEQTQALGSGPADGARRGRALAATGLLAAAAVTAVIVLGGGDAAKPGDATPSPAGTATPATGAAPRVLDTIDVLDRPNGVVATPDGIWVASFADERLMRLDPARNAVALTTKRIGEGISDIVSDGRDVWVAASRSNEVIRVDGKTGKVRGRIAVTKPAVLAVDERGIWVGTRTEVAGGPDLLMRFARDGREVKRLEQDFGVAALLLTGNQLWIGHRRFDNVSHLDVQTAEQQLVRKRLGGRIVDLAASDGYVWASTEAGTLARIARDSDTISEFAAGRRSGEVAAAGGRVFVVDTLEGLVYPFDAASGRRDQPLEIGPEPFAIEASGGRGYVTLRTSGEVRVLATGRAG